MDRSIRLLLAIPHLGGGGAERVIATLAQHLNPHLFEIHLVLFTPDGPGSPVLPQHVVVHRLNVRRVRHAAVPLLRLIRTLKPRLILSGMAHLNFLILLLLPFLPRHTRILIRQNTTASVAAQSWLSRFGYRRLYPKAYRILCQSEAMANDLVEHFGLSPEHLVVLRNPIVMPAAEPRLSPRSVGQSGDAAGPNLLFVGRLSHEKGLDLLLHAFAELRLQFPEASLTVLGTGPEEPALHNLAKFLGIAPAVHFVGHSDPAPFFRTATLFVLPSRYEGIPNALLESAAAGLPIVATRASEGLVDLLHHAPGCWLVPRITPAALAESMSHALLELANLPSRFSHAFLEPFRMEAAMQAYSDLLLSSSRPSLAFLIPTLDQVGGAERQVLDLAQELAARSWPVTLVTLSGNGAAMSSLAGIRHLSLRMRKAWVDPRGWLRYWRWHRAAQPEILHAHLPHASYFARLSRLLAPTPVLIDTIHTTAAGPLSRRLAYRFTHCLTDCLTCVSQAVQQCVQAARIAPHSLLLPNGIRVSESSLERCMSPAPGNSFRWLAVGRLTRVKDYPTLLRAFRLLPDTTLLAIAGSGPDEAALRALADELRIARRVDFLGFRADIQPFLAQSDALVQSSLWEGLPISILEASAAALPVVATDASGNREALVPGLTGFLVPVGDAEALAAAMCSLMELSFDQRRRIGRHGHAFVRARFSLSTVVDQWEQLYHQLLQEVRAPEAAQTISVRNYAG